MQTRGQKLELVVDMRSKLAALKKKMKMACCYVESKQLSVKNTIYANFSTAYKINMEARKTSPEAKTLACTNGPPPCIIQGCQENDTVSIKLLLATSTSSPLAQTK
ncbi:hypothetical protein ILYODFUR_029068 [Ilyodon furcidens]|uniref:Uncharacterized protein n=1 Tax=Ilyodon furcidens TaxID=33524 RepID=A0ABV0TBY6_9TELE